MIDNPCQGTDYNTMQITDRLLENRRDVLSRAAVESNIFCYCWHCIVLSVHFKVWFENHWQGYKVTKSGLHPVPKYLLCPLPQKKTLFINSTMSLKKTNHILISAHWEVYFKKHISKISIHNFPKANNIFPGFFFSFFLYKFFHNDYRKWEIIIMWNDVINVTFLYRPHLR